MRRSEFLNKEMDKDPEILPSSMGDMLGTVRKSMEMGEEIMNHLWPKQELPEKKEVLLKKHFLNVLERFRELPDQFWSDYGKMFRLNSPIFKGFRAGNAMAPSVIYVLQNAPWLVMEHYKNPKETLEWCGYIPAR